MPNDKLRPIGIINTSDLLAKFAKTKREKYAVCFEGADHGRDGHGARAYIWSPVHATDPDGPWYHHGRKTFYGSRSVALPQALAWACKKTGTKPDAWATDPTDRNTLVLKAVRERALAALKRKADSEADSEAG